MSVTVKKKRWNIYYFGSLKLCDVSVLCLVQIIIITACIGRLVV